MTTPRPRSPPAPSPPPRPAPARAAGGARPGWVGWAGLGRRLLPAVAVAVAVAAWAFRPANAPAAGTDPAPAAVPPPAAAAAAAAVAPGGRALRALLDAAWEQHLADSPEQASFSGDERFNDRWTDLSAEAIARRHDRDVDTLRRLPQEVDRAGLSPADQLTYDLFEQDVRTRVEAYPFRWHLVPFNQLGGPQLADQVADALPFRTAKHYEDWLARLRALPAYLRQVTALLREGIRARVLLPKVVMRRVDGQLDKQITARPEDSPCYRPFQNFPATLPAADQDRYRTAARQVIAGQVVPAYAEFKRFYDEEYLPACFDQVGIWQIPDGAAAYAQMVRVHTTTDLSPAQIHQLGRREVARIRAEMDAVMRRVGWTGTREEFFRFLRSDPRFFYADGAALLNAYRALAKTIDPQLVRFFRVLPRTPYGVEPIPDNLAPDTYPAYYREPAADGSRAGTYCVNLYRPEVRPKWEMPALTLHESVPGHHLQIALAQELGELPPFRRQGQYTAYVEGWALYAESLGEQMGLYDDPYAKFGELTYDMWRAVRLVVDTGIHADRWDRQRAIDYFTENAPKSALDIANEVDRYIAWPGQALAYKVGQLKIQELRARAEAALGARFDQRDFHRVLLGAGALPLDLLERRVDDWLREAGPTPAGVGAAAGER